MNFQQAVEAYFYRECALAVKDERSYTDFDVRHEEGWSNDDGTSWPATTYITYREHWIGKTGQKHSRKKEVMAVEDDPIEFARALFDYDK